MECLERGAHLARGLPPVFAALSKRPGDDGLQSGVAERRRIDADDRVHRVAHAAGKRLVARRHLVKHRPEREDVGAGIQHFSARLLGRHVVDRADRGAGTGDGRDRRVVGRGLHDDFGQPEVQHLDLAPARHEDVGRLEVPVHDAVAMRLLQRARNLDPPRDLPGAIDAGPDTLGERLSVEKFQDQIALPVSLADVVNRADVRVVQRRDDAGFPPEAILDSALGVRPIVEQDLDRHHPAEADVFGLVHGPHPALTEGRDDAVRADGRANHGAGGGRF